MLLLLGEGSAYSVTPERRVVPARGVLSLYPPEGRPLHPLLQVPDSVTQGRVLTVLVASQDPLETLHATLRGPRGLGVVTARGFALPYVAPQGPPIPAPAADPAGPAAPVRRATAWALLLGAPAEGVPGQWWLEVEGRSGERSFSYARGVEVVAGRFRETRVRLSQSLTSLRTRSDDRTAQDQRRLAAALRSFSEQEVADLGPARPPLDRAVQSAGFGDRRVYLYADGRTAWSIHRGLDLVVPDGTPVRATSQGSVVLAEELVVSGNTVAVESLPGVIDLFYHLSAILVESGQRIEPGQVVGRVGATGLATGAHLHWEQRVGGVAVHPNPGAPLVDKGVLMRIIAACESQDPGR
jgi:biotin carboxyl carrier protein